MQILRALSSLRGLRGAPEVPPLCRETSVSGTANVGTVGMNGLINVDRMQTTEASFLLLTSVRVYIVILFHYWLLRN